MMNIRGIPVARRSMTVAALAALGVWSLWALGMLDIVERPVGDVMLRLPRPGVEAEGPFVAVLIDDPSVEGLGPLPWPRSVLAFMVDAIRAQGARAVVVDLLLTDRGPPAEDAALAAALDRGPTALAAVLAPHAGWILPDQRFGGPVRAAHAHAEVASDGVVRSIATSKQSGGLALPALSIAAARLAGWSGSIPVGEAVRPDFRQPPDAITAVSARQILNGVEEPHRFDGRVVFVGLTASGAGDQFVVPVGPRDRPAPGVLVHASAASSILRGGLLTVPSGWLVLSIMWAAVLAVQWLRSRTGRLAILRLAGIAGLLAASTVAALWWADVQLPLVSLLLVVAVSAVGREALESVEAQREAGKVLASLLDSESTTPGAELPIAVAGRLQLARRLQRQIARDSELRNALLDGLREGVVLWDGDGRVLLANDAAGRLWGTAPTRLEVTTALGEVGGATAEVKGEVEVDGHNLEVEVRSIDAGTLGLLRDVTAARELERSRREVQRMVSHELKTPLSSISGFGSMIERYELSREEQLRVAGLIRGEADRLGDMVRSFLDLERLGAGRWEGAQGPVDLAALARRRCDFLRPGAEQGRHPVTVSTSGSCAVIGSEDLLTRLIDNLVGNATRHTPEGTEVRVTVETFGATVELAVADDGPGIDPAALPRLFDRFFRGPGGGPGGSGLGLALVREIATWHGATVAVDSEVGRGSTFTVRFPAASAAGSHHET